MLNRKINHQSMYINNKRSVLKILLENRNISRADISRDLNLNKPSVSRIIKEYIDQGWVVEKKLLDTNSKLGKNPILLNINSEKKILGIRINEFESSFVISDVYGDIFYKKTVSLGAGKEFKKNFNKMLKNIKSEFNNDFIAIGLVFPGIVNHSMVHFSYNLQIKDFDVSYISEAIFQGVPVFLENDSRAAALCEKNFEDTSLQDFFYVLFKVDYINSILYMGSSFFIHNEIVGGANNFAGEIIDISCSEDGIKHINVGNNSEWTMTSELSHLLLEELRRLFIFLNPKKVIFGGNISKNKSQFVYMTIKMIDDLKQEYYTYDVNFSVSTVKNPVELGAVALVVHNLKNGKFQIL